LKEIIWTHEALERLEDIQYYLAVQQKAPQAAHEMIDRLIGRVPQIQEMPLSGREVPNYGILNIREQLEPPYRIIYMITEDSVYVMSSMHQRQLLPKKKAMKAAVESVLKA